MARTKQGRRPGGGGTAGCIALVLALSASAISAGRADAGEEWNLPDRGESREAARERGEGVFRFDPGLQVWTLLSFATMLLLLWKFAFPPLVRALEERERAIRDSVDAARRRQEEAEALLQSYKDRLDKAQEEAHRILEEGRRLAEAARQEIAGKAQEESRRILERAEIEIGRMKEKGIEELRETVGHLSVEIAARVLHAEIDESAHRKLVDGLLSELKDQHGAGTS